MKNNEIIKALECCAQPIPICKECPCYDSNFPYPCADQLKWETLNLIDSQQAEIEKLRELLEMADKAMKIANKTADLMREQYERAKFEAIKEFAERLKDKSLTKWDYHDAVDIEEIDNLVKEMVGDTE